MGRPLEKGRLLLLRLDGGDVGRGIGDGKGRDRRIGLCRGGACGQCETHVLEAATGIEHHDVWLSDEAKACNSHFMPCISRADGGTLVVDL